MRFSILVITLLFGLYSPREVLSQECSSAMTCSLCYDIPNCAWCSSANFTGTRCFSTSDTVSINMCSMIENNPSETLIDPLELSSDNQISLRKATVRLRAGATQQITVSIRAAENYPLDLYMLSDFSFSLKDDLNTLRGIAQDIADAIKNISTRFQVGFGTFVDKLTLPYTSNAQILGLAACADCGFPLFNYVHNINLTNDSALFANGFQTVNISTNVDNPEGTFDALLQAALCDKIVGWRPEARKIILLITDDVVHTAGDGKLAGIVRPVPNSCLTAYDATTGRYTYINDLEYDYPSLEQLRQVFTDNIIVPVFAVTEKVLDLFNNIATLLEGSNAFTASLTGNSSNIISVIETAYESIISNVSLSFPVTDGINIEYTADCPVNSLANPNGLACSNVTVNDTTTFTINVTLTQCNDNFRKNITMTVPAYGNFLIEVIGICECDCQEEAVVNSMDCNNNGTLSCGVCECNQGWTGDMCTCFQIEDLTCPTSINNAECSNRGQCDCGRCVCNEPSSVIMSTVNNMTRYNVTDSLLLGNDLTVVLTEPPRVYGNACECDNFRCPVNLRDNLVCSGSTNGNCTCDNGEVTCRCNTLAYGNFTFFGTSCQCNDAYCYNTSIPFGESQSCNNAGTCNPCNIDQPCTCNAGFIGRYCVPAATFTSQCNPTLNGCVRCIADNANYNESCESCISSFSHRYSRLPGNVEETHQIANSRINSTQRCTFLISDPLCRYVYFIGEPHPDSSSQARLVAVQPRSGCSPLRWWHVALILLAVLIIAGITLLVIIKLIFLCLDYAELKKFQKEVAEADLSKNFNPLYQSPEVKYDNVAFGKE